MSVKFKTKVNKFPQMEASIKGINGRKIKVGVFGEHAWLAGIHEYGMVIKAKNKKYLTVPCNKKAKEKKAGDFKDLFVFTAKSGEKFLARSGRKKELELLFWLTESVNIPERAFLRGGFDSCHERVVDRAERAFASMLTSKEVPLEMLKSIGQMLATQIKTYARNLDTPANKSMTIETKGSTHPLRDTGNMINSIEAIIEDE